MDDIRDIKERKLRISQFSHPGARVSHYSSPLGTILSIQGFKSSGNFNHLYKVNASPSKRVHSKYYIILCLMLTFPLSEECTFRVKVMSINLWIFCLLWHGMVIWEWSGSWIQLISVYRLVMASWRHDARLSAAPSPMTQHSPAVSTQGQI